MTTRKGELYRKYYALTDAVRVGSFIEQERSCEICKKVELNVQKVYTID